MKKEKKGIKPGNEKVKSLWFAVDKTVYVENPKGSTNKLLTLAFEFSLLDIILLYRIQLSFYTSKN